MKKSDVLREVAGLVEQLIAEQREKPTAWLVHAIVSAHKKQTDDEYNDLASYELASNAVRLVTQKYKRGDTDPSQLSFTVDGVERIQEAYIIPRDGVGWFVPIDRLTQGEIDAKLTELAAMRDGAAEHHEQLLRFRVLKFGPVSSTGRAAR